MTIANNREPVTLTVHRKTDRIKVKPKRWNHQDDLASLKGQKLVIGIVNGNHQTCVLLESDQFTIKVQTFTMDGKPHSILTYFKHHIGYFGVAK